MKMSFTYIRCTVYYNHKFSHGSYLGAGGNARAKREVHASWQAAELNSCSTNSLPITLFTNVGERADVDDSVASEAVAVALLAGDCNC